MKEHEIKVMNAILSRVLSKEIGNQRRWSTQDDRGQERQEIIDIIIKFMKENKIEIRTDYI